jgi:hypothetical protein
VATVAFMAWLGSGFLGAILQKEETRCMLDAKRDRPIRANVLRPFSPCDKVHDIDGPGMYPSQLD